VFYADGPDIEYLIRTLHEAMGGDWETREDITIEFANHSEAGVNALFWDGHARALDWIFNGNDMVCMNMELAPSKGSTLWQGCADIYTDQARVDRWSPRLLEFMSAQDCKLGNHYFHPLEDPFMGRNGTANYGDDPPYTPYSRDCYWAGPDTEDVGGSDAEGNTIVGCLEDKDVPYNGPDWDEYLADWSVEDLDQ
jgi:prepilin-type processing-associated H-X9-DG protein